jgi:Tfp pilus assembly protein PilV
MNLQNPELRIQNPRGRRAECSAFTLLEVMVAVAIFFTCTFAILGLMSQTLRNARSLQAHEPDVGMLAGQISLTNSLTMETESGNFGEDFPGYTWSRDVYQVASNGLWQADFVIHRKAGRKDVEMRGSVLLFRPQSPETAPRGGLE